MVSIATTQPPLVQRLYGVRLGIHPSSDTRFGVELQHTTSTGGTWKVAAAISPNTAVHQGERTVYYPNDHVVRAFRARHALFGWVAGNYTAVVKARPTLLSAQPRPMTPPLSAIGVGAGGVTGSTIGGITKTHFLGGEMFTHKTSEPFEYWGGGLTPVTTEPSKGQRTFQLPVGVTLTNISVHYWRNSTAIPPLLSMLFGVRRITTASPPGMDDEILAQTAPTTTGFGVWPSTDISGLPYVALPRDQFYIEILMTQGSSFDGRYHGCEVSYTMPNYNAAI